MEKLSKGIYNQCICLLILFTICLNPVKSKGQVLQDLEKNFNKVHNATLYEKLYLHISKTTFITGETIWFKIYNTDSENKSLLDLSKVAYVELIDNERHPVLQAKIALSNCTGSGSFSLPHSLNNGIYQLRAYTNWMKNFDSEAYFQEQITILNPQREISDFKDKVINYDVQFFPEGGHLVRGLENRLAFKITTPGNQIVNATGVLVNSKNDTVARFKTLKFGMGSFSFVPISSNGYKAVLKINGRLYYKNLSPIDSLGYGMRTNADSAGWTVAVKSNLINSSNVYMIVHTDASIQIAEKAPLVAGKASFKINKHKLVDGISYITLFDEQKTPICERLLFQRPNRHLIIDAKTDALTFSTRQKVKLNLSTQDENRQAVGSNLSVAVFLSDTLQKSLNQDIEAYLWLCSGLKGYVESPSYYLNENTLESKQALENLLLTQGWTQFEWKKEATETSKRLYYLPEYTGPIITAKIINTYTQKPAANIIAYLTVPGKYHQLYSAKSDIEGRLLFNTKGSYGSKEIVVKTNPLIDSTYTIDVLNPYSETNFDYQSRQLILPALAYPVISNNYLNAQVDQLFTKEIYENEIPDSTYFYQKTDYSYRLDDYVRFKTLSEVMHEYVRSVDVSTKNSKPFFRMISNKNLLLGQAVAIVDGEPIFDSGEIYNIDPFKVKQLDIVNTNYIYGPAVFSGIIGVTTYNADNGGLILDPKAVTIAYDGLQLRRKFYSPAYESVQQMASPIPDFRTTLYWNPKADTDNQGNKSILFYTGDKQGRFVGIVEGMTKNGAAGSKLFYFDIKK